MRKTPRTNWQRSHQNTPTLTNGTAASVSYGNSKFEGEKSKVKKQTQPRVVIQYRKHEDRGDQGCNGWEGTSHPHSSSCSRTGTEPVVSKHQPSQDH